jgi:hypothetical protein
MFSYSSLVNKGKLTLPSVDSWGTNNNIQKDPPRSIKTRRIDKVSDNNDITKMIDNSDRSTEAILRFARGVNPSVSVSYSNNGGIMQNFGNQQAFLPYRINKDNDFHPPVQAPQDLLPLSRLPINNVTVNTLPSMPHFTKELDNARNQTASKNVHQKIVSSAVSATKTYMLQRPFQEPFEIKYNILENPLKINSEGTKIAFSDRTIQNNVIPTKTILMDNLTISADTNKQDLKTHISPQDVDLSKIKMQDVKLIEYNTAVKGNEKVELVHEMFELERNVPVYDSHTNVQGLSHIKFAANDADLHLTRNLPEYQLFANTSSKNTSNISHLHNDIVLTRNVPEHTSHSNISGNRKTNFIHNDIELTRVLPEHEATTNISQNMRKTNMHDKMKEYERKSILSHMTTNDSMMGDTSKSSRDYHLQDKIQPGEFNNPGFVPQVDRMHNTNYKMNNDKLKIAKASFNLFNQSSH